MLIDSHNRIIDYLRISVIKECNFRCLYCMPNIPFDYKFDDDLLSFAELFELIKIFIDNGIKKIRITGGEPLLRPNLHELIYLIHTYNPNVDLALSTNAFLLKNQAKLLKQSGLKRINISLDTLNSYKARKLYQKNVLDRILEGLNEAIKLDFKIKINSVILRGFNDDEIISLLEFAMQKQIELRYIEFMENYHAYKALKGLNSKEILDKIKQKYKFTIHNSISSSPSKLYILKNNYKFGIIDPHSTEFCTRCNRLRLDASGSLIPCLYYDDALSLKDALKTRDINKIKHILTQILKTKPKENKWNIKNNQISNRAFYHTGG